MGAPVVGIPCLTAEMQPCGPDCGAKCPGNQLKVPEADLVQLMIS